MSFDPNATGQKDSGVFALPYDYDKAQLIFIPVPWEVTTSFGHGTSMGPDGVFAASKQMDLCDGLFGEFYTHGIYQFPTPEEILSQSRLLKEKALFLRDLLEKGEEIKGEDADIQGEINKASSELNDWLYEKAKTCLDQNKWVAAVGGDHSAPYGLIKALKEKFAKMSILHVDAHMDLRRAYQGYDHSHASIMYNVMQDLQPEALVQLGIRDFCPEEKAFSDDNKRIHSYLDSQVNLRLSDGESWRAICREAVSKLSDEVYISFDVDGLTPDLCPNTGTPVPGGLSFPQMEALLHEVVESGKRVVGFDLCEVAPESQYDLEGWDANVGARILFKLAGCLLRSQNPNP